MICDRRRHYLPFVEQICHFRDRKCIPMLSRFFMYKIYFQIFIFMFRKTWITCLLSFVHIKILNSGQINKCIPFSVLQVINNMQKSLELLFFSIWCLYSCVLLANLDVPKISRITVARVTIPWTRCALVLFKTTLLQKCRRS